ncbi:hypothetical protein G7Y89_g10310 [Cudoniella acicularis]|uniref:Uncharacterized protein n=1 Tax=Cudoniella acicularis TaxID=354080 RepID=A0A8H4W1R7_9HELO|nr:hypothetical protein G7Y89_g10310 [Cudoniella acicularis]
MPPTVEKYNIYFNFGPNESYFFRGIAQTRSCGDIAGRKGEWIKDWKKYDCVAWKGEFYFACRRRDDCVNHCKVVVPNGAGGEFKTWVETRTFAPLRLVTGAGPGNWFAWMLHGDFATGPNTPEAMRQSARALTKAYTNIRIASIGVGNTYLLIWEDGSMIYELEDKYPELLEKLEELKGKGDEVSWVVMNPFRAGDYFLYLDKDKMASFRVSENFGSELEKALHADGIDTKDLVIRTAEVVAPVKIRHLIASNMVAVAEKNVEINSDAVVNAATKVFKTAVVVVKAGAVIAGIVACTVM